VRGLYAQKEEAVARSHRTQPAHTSAANRAPCSVIFLYAAVKSRKKSSWSAAYFSIHSTLGASTARFLSEVSPMWLAISRSSLVALGSAHGRFSSVR